MTASLVLWQTVSLGFILRESSCSTARSEPLLRDLHTTIQCGLSSQANDCIICSTFSQTSWQWLLHYTNWILTTLNVSFLASSDTDNCTDFFRIAWLFTPTAWHPTVQSGTVDLHTIINVVIFLCSDTDIDFVLDGSTHLHSSHFTAHLLHRLLG